MRPARTARGGGRTPGVDWPDPVTDPADDPTPPSAAPRPKRTRKFVMPDAQHDERTTKRIEAFIEGPPELRQRRQGPYIERDRRPVELDTRADWLGAFRYEAARHARYGRPASVLLVELPGGQGDVAYDRMARQFTDIMRAEARDPDRAVRMGRSRFQLLLPETVVARRACRGGAAPARVHGDPGRLVGVPTRPAHRDRHAPPDGVARGRRRARGASPQVVIRPGPGPVRRASRPGGPARPPGRRTGRCGPRTAG